MANRKKPLPGCWRDYFHEEDKNSGMTIADIAKRFGVVSNTITVWRKSSGAFDLLVARCCAKPLDTIDESEIRNATAALKRKTDLRPDYIRFANDARLPVGVIALLRLAGDSPDPVRYE